MLDLRTLALITMMSAIVFAFAAAMVWRLVPQEESLRDWTTGSILMAVSTLLLGLRDIVPDFLSIIVANSALVSSLGILHVGTRNLFGRGSGPPWHWLAGGAMFFACIIFTYVAPNLPMRLIALSLLISPFFVASGWIFWRCQESQLKIVDRLTAVIFSAGALLFIARAVVAFGAAVSVDYTSTSSGLLVAPYFYSILFNVWMATMVTLTVSARLQRRVEDALGRSEAANRELCAAQNFNETILINSPLPMGVYAASGQCVRANDAYARFVGATREALLAQNFHNIASWRVTGVLDDCLSALAHHKSRRRETHVTSSFGKEVWFEYQILPIYTSGEHHLLIQFFDLTERREHQQRLERLVTEQNAMLETDLVGIVRVKDRKNVWVNRAFENILGYGKGELTGTPIRQNYPDNETYLALGAAAYPVLAAGQVYRTQIENVRKDGKHVWLDISGAILDKATGESLWALVDITERKQLEQRIAQSEQRMELALGGADLGLWDVDVFSGKVTHNPRLVTMLGYTPDEVELTGELAASLLHLDDAARVGAAFYAHLEGDTPSVEAEYRARHKDGHWVWIMSRGKVVERNRHGYAIRVTGTNLDITARKQAEAEHASLEARLRES